MGILTPVENAVGVVALNLEFNTHFNISKLLWSSLLSYKTTDLSCSFSISINMYNKDQNCGTIVNVGVTCTDTVHLCWSCLQMSRTSISCIEVTCRHACLDTQYVMDAEKAFSLVSYMST